MITEGQQLALEQLKAIESEDNYLFEILSTKFSDDDKWMTIDVSLYCGNLRIVTDGLPLREREQFVLFIPQNFPFEKPSAWVKHYRFAGRPHVQWKRFLCLYQSPQTEWNVSDGMFGFIERLWYWLKQGALNQLDPEGAPIHPPVTYISSDEPIVVVPRQNTPTITDEPWFGFAEIKMIHQKRIDIVGWAELSSQELPSIVGAVILLPKKMPFEFPNKVSELLIELVKKNIHPQRILLVLQLAAIKIKENNPLYFVIGTAMRGKSGATNLRQHLTVWRIEPTIVKALKLSINKYSENEVVSKIGDDVEKIIWNWAANAKVDWCRVLEGREEIVYRRDQATPVSIFKDKTVSLWGCGALGANIAIYLAQAGIRKIILRDFSIVKPGLLVRQPFEENDIGVAKVRALEKRLIQLRPDLEIIIENTNIVSFLNQDKNWIDGSDIIIDCTASNIVHYKLEYIRKDSEQNPSFIISMMINRNAEKGIVVVLRNDFSGSLVDIFRKVKLEIYKKFWLHSFKEFYPEDKQIDYFQPEPGCSEPTFIGSGADSSALASIMLNCAAKNLQTKSEFSASAYLTTQPHAIIDSSQGQSFYNIHWQADLICQDQISGYEVRISPNAIKEIDACISRSVRINGNKVETGGLLFGKRDDSLKVVWVSEVIGPPSDSISSEIIFICGVEGTVKIHNTKKLNSGGEVGYIGMWHTHPFKLPLPSEIDLAGMEKILTLGPQPPSKNLLLIIGTGNEKREIGAFVFKRSDFFENKIVVCSTRKLKEVKLESETIPNIGLALSGGGSRAIAFHLGCLRALNDRGILNKIQIISGVSGGSIISAMYAYSNCSFEEFENRVSKFLINGFQWRIAYQLFFSSKIFESFITSIFAGSSTLLARIIGKQPPFRRWTSRTNAFEKALENKLFADLKITGPRRNNIDVVLNSCELRTGTAFRFGSRESGSWRIGTVKENDVKLSNAVAASAAYPIFLPAIDQEFDFEKDGSLTAKRVILSDGGVYENLGVSCLEPDRDPKYSYNIYKPDYIICCNAGYGLFDPSFIPYGFFTRFGRSLEVTHKKVQDATMSRLHHYVSTGKLKGFILSYLGQQEKSLPYIPKDLISRKQVNYPTNFKAMSNKDVHLISTRGEQLTRLLIDFYCPEL